jgi:hypothetical protein
MKKWLIFAVIAAMFAMVMVAACGGGDEGGSDGAASDVRVFVNQISPNATAALIQWNGDPSYEYGVYYQVIDQLQTIYPVIYMGLGQNLYTYTASGGAAELNTQGPNLWQYYLASGASTNPGGLGGVTLGAIIASASAVSSSSAVRFGVGALNPGGFQVSENIEALIAWSAQVPFETPMDEKFLQP